MNAAYDLVPVGLARRAVRRRRDVPFPTGLWAHQSSTAWTAVAEAFRAPLDDKGRLGYLHDADGMVESGSIGGQRDGGAVGGGRRGENEYIDNPDGSLSLPSADKYGPEWWESTLRIIVYDAAAETAAFGLERALAVPDGERGEAERRLMVEAALFLEAVIRRGERRCAVWAYRRAAGGAAG